MGNHNLTVGDVDSDGKDEIIEGSCAIDHDGKFMYRTGLGHGDAMHLGDLDPSHAGLEVWEVHEETGSSYGYEMHDAKTGQILWGTNTGTDNGRGLAADIDSSYAGYEMWSSSGAGHYTAKGVQINTNKPSMNFRIYWNGDLQDEVLDAIGSTPSPMKIDSWLYGGRLVSTDTRYGAYVGWTNNTTKSNPVLVADLFGDWREEMILRQSNDSALIVYSTAIPSAHRLYTLMHDPVYRASISWQNTAYNQPPHLGFFLGAGVAKAPKPDITLVGGAPPVPTDCNGTANGTASLDSCGRCVGGTTGRTACSSWIEGEAFCSADGVLEGSNAGFFGTGYLNLNNAVGTAGTWAASAASAGNQKIAIRYANGGTTDRPVSVSVGGTTAVASLSLPATGSWATWSVVETTIPLAVGGNLIKLASLTADGAANIDRIGFLASGIAKGSCVSTSVQRPAIDGIRLTAQGVLLGDVEGASATARNPAGQSVSLRPASGMIDFSGLSSGIWLVELRGPDGLLMRGTIVRP